MAIRSLTVRGANTVELNRSKGLALVGTERKTNEPIIGSDNWEFGNPLVSGL